LIRHHAAKVQATQRRLAVLKTETAFKDVKTGKSLWADCDEVETLNDQLVMLKSVARAAIGKSKVRLTLYEELVSASSANTAIANSFALVPSACGEWTAMSGLYDECKVLGVTVTHVFGINVNTTVPTGGGAVWVALGYDSTYNTAPSGTTDVLESSQHHLTACETASGYGVMPAKPVVWNIKIPDGPVANAAAVTGGTGIVANFPGEWMAMGDGADSVGYMRLYVPPAGTGAIIGYRMIRAYHCEFRERT